MFVKPTTVQSHAGTEPVIINCTPHPVNIYVGTVFDETSRKSKGGWLQKEIPPSGKKVVVISSVTPKPELNLNGTPVPICTRKFESITHLPKEAGTYYIVPSLYVTAAKELGRDVSDLLAPCGEVIDASGRQIGCTSLALCA